MNALHDNEKEMLTIQVVSDILENLIPIDRIITLAYYADNFDVKYLSEILETSLDFIKYELGIANDYIKDECLKYELENNCTLASINDDIIHEAFIQLFKQDRYLINTK